MSTVVSPIIPYDRVNLSETYIGPYIVEEFIRVKDDYSSNLAASYVPRILLNSSGSDSAKVETRLTKPRVTLQILQELEADIANHVEYRLQVLFMQTVLVYKTMLPFVFYNQAIGQVGQANMSQSMAKGDANLDQDSYEGAHSSTLPCLRVFRNGSGSDTKSIAFAHGSYFFETWNATVYLPKMVNTIDRLIDVEFTYVGGESFRSMVTRILTAVSLGAWNPKQGFECFVNSLVVIIDNCMKKKQEPENLLILQTYRKIAEVYRVSLVEGDDIVKALSFRKNAAQCDDAFYVSVQIEMARQFIKKMYPLRPGLILHLKAAEEKDYSPLRAVMMDQYKQALEAPQLSRRDARNHLQTAGLYLAMCQTNMAGRSVVILWLDEISAIETSNNGALKQNLRRIWELTSAYPSNALSLPNRILRLHFFSLRLIRDQKEVEKPKDLIIILLRLIYDVSADPRLNV